MGGVTVLPAELKRRVPGVSELVVVAVEGWPLLDNLVAMQGVLWLVLNGHLKSGQLRTVPARNAYKESPALDGFHLAGSSSGSW